MRKYATLSPTAIKNYLEDGWKVNAYGGKDGYISEISFSKKKDGSLMGFSYDVGCGLRQRELKSLLNRIKKVKKNLKLQTGA